MRYFRIDEHAMEHEKIAGLTDGAFRLWVQGLAYCSKFLTNGRISTKALRLLRAYSPSRMRLLVSALLWEEIPEGVNVHDYLEWNDSRELVEGKREQARERAQKSRSGRAPHVQRTCADVTELIQTQRNTTQHNATQVETPRASTPAKVAFDGHRLRVWHWQHEEFGRMLGAKASEFDLLAWYQRLDEALVRTGESYAEPDKWLRERFYADSGVPLPNLMGRSRPVSDKSRLTQALEKAGNW